MSAVLLDLHKRGLGFHVVAKENPEYSISFTADQEEGIELSLDFPLSLYFFFTPKPEGKDFLPYIRIMDFVLNENGIHHYSKQKNKPIQLDPVIRFDEGLSAANIMALIGSRKNTESGS